MDEIVQRALTAAHGYLDLGMHQEAWDELEALPPELRAEDAVLELRIDLYLALEKWAPARVLAESLARQAPENPGWWLLWAYALRRETSIEAAREVLREAADRHADVPLITYNLGCYACVIGEIEEAKGLLMRAFEADPELKKVALDDPDLEAIFGVIKKKQPPTGAGA